MNYEYANGKRIRIGFRSPGLTRSCSPTQKIELAVELGMSIIEPQFPREFPEPHMVAEMQSACRKHGVSVPSMGCELPLTTRNAKPAIDEVLASFIACAKALGATYMFSRVMPQAKDITQKEAWDLLIANGRYTAVRLAQHGIVWAIEADPPCFINSLERLERAITNIDHKNCRPNYDPTNLYVAGSDPLKAIDVFGASIISGHIKDGFFRGPKPEDHGELAIGQGELDYASIFTAFIKAELSVNMYIEHCKSPGEICAAAKHVAEVIEQLCS